MFLNPPSVIFKTFIPPSPLQLKSTFLSSTHHPLYNWIQYFSIYSSCLSIFSHSFLSLLSFPYFQFFSLINPTSSLILSLLFFSLPLDPFFQLSQAFDPFPTFLLLQFLSLLFSLHLDPFPFFSYFYMQFNSSVSPSSGFPLPYTYGSIPCIPLIPFLPHFLISRSPPPKQSDPPFPT